MDRSTTPAMANRHASAPRMGGHVASSDVPYASNRSLTPHRLYGRSTPNPPDTPSSTGLIRLSLKKPMGIVFEPMYDPNQPSVQRGVRICDLPRTGAAALSRKLQVGDELLQINETTVSRLNFDEIMDFIIEADPEAVNLLFRRPRKEAIQARIGMPQKINAAKEKESAVKWEAGVTEHKRDVVKHNVSEDDSATMQSSLSESVKKKKKKTHKGGPYESENFLDILIDTICQSNVCRDTFRANNDDSDDETFDEESTYVTYEESIQPKQKKWNKKTKNEENYQAKKNKKNYEDDGTLETLQTEDRIKVPPVNNVLPEPAPQPTPPLGLSTTTPTPPPEDEVTDIGNPAPIREVAYDEGVDHGADVSVMESLGGPSLLIEKQRNAMQPIITTNAETTQQQMVSPELMEKFGQDFPVEKGLTREQSIQKDPLKFYTFVVKNLLHEHEPEKVRLLEKLLTKYKGREDHLVQKLAVRYESQVPAIPEENNDDDDEEAAFHDAVKKSKASTTAEVVVNAAKERYEEEEREGPDSERPAKEEKDPELEEYPEDTPSGESDYSGDDVDGTSPAVIAQVSELLNYVYGKTSVPGQIDRVSTIMRAYEGREAVLLELLETKALIKANKEKENSEDLPSFLRNSTNAAQKNAHELSHSDLPPVTPMASQSQGAGSDDISSMSGVSSPADNPVLQSHSVRVCMFVLE